MGMRTLLFVGRRNAARSVMAETCFNAAGIAGWRAFSAGWQTQNSVDRQALAVLEANGLATDALTSKPVAIFRQAGAPAIDYCVFLDEILPPDVADYPGPRDFWRIADPSREAGRGGAYEKALGEISRRVALLAASGRLLELAPELAIAS